MGTGKFQCQRALRFGNRPELRASRGPGPFLADTLDFRAAKDAATPERALEVVGQALLEQPGDKDLIFLGWGLPLGLVEDLINEWAEVLGWWDQSRKISTGVKGASGKRAYHGIVVFLVGGVSTCY